MAIVTSYDGRRGLLARLLPYLGTLRIRLYVPDIYPHPERVSAQYVEPTFAGYRPLPLTQWGTVYLTLQGDAIVDHQAVKWTCTAGGGTDTVYGYWISDPAGRWLLAERDERGGQEVRVAGTIYSVVPRLSLGALCTPDSGAWQGGVIFGGSWLSEV